VSEAARALESLLELMRRLRDPETGCPWDREQTFATIAPYTLEEAYEVAAAIEEGDPARLRDELGDLLFQVVFHARMAEERGWFDFAAVATSIDAKLRRRHPHLFGGEMPGSAREQSARWEELKAAERAGQPGEDSVVGGIARSLPALTRAAKLGRRAARVGFDWPDAAGVRAKLAEELAEADAALAEAQAQGASPAASPRVAEELGDLLFAVANWSRHLEVEPEGALRAASSKFERRFRRMEALAAAQGRGLRTLDAAAWDALWEQAKLEERS
jgi:nucleoside triphosphate diphosphatase